MMGWKSKTMFSELKTRITTVRLLIALTLLTSLAAVYAFYNHTTVTYMVTPAPDNVDDGECPLQTPPPRTVIDDSGKYLQPFYLHYVRFKPHGSDLTFGFVDYLSVMSGVQRLHPDGIFLHGDHEPTGVYWDRLKTARFIQYKKRKAPKFAGKRMGKRIELGWKEHAADLTKLDVLLEYGGVAIDFDVFFVRGQLIKEILRHRRIITCYGDEDGYNIGFVAAWPDSQLLYAWRRSYHDIYVKDWNFNQAQVGKYLSVLYKEEAYVVNHVCNNPVYDHREVYFREYGAMNWTNSLAVHSYERHGGVAIEKPEDLYTGPLTTHKELLACIYENCTLPAYWHNFRDEMDPVTDKLKQ